MVLYDLFEIPFMFKVIFDDSALEEAVSQCILDRLILVEREVSNRLFEGFDLIFQRFLAFVVLFRECLHLCAILFDLLLCFGVPFFHLFLELQPKSQLLHRLFYNFIFLAQLVERGSQLIFVLAALCL